MVFNRDKYEENFRISKIHCINCRCSSRNSNPGIVDQYGKNLGSRTAESVRSLSEFQDDADRYFDGDLNKLIEHYAKKNDPVIISGGESIAALLLRNQQLVKAQKSFNSSIYNQYFHVFITPIAEISLDVWTNYTYKVVLNGSAISVGVVSGLLTLASFELLIFFFNLVFHTLKNKVHRVPKPPQLSFLDIYPLPIKVQNFSGN